VKPFLGYKKTAHNTYLSILVEEGLIGFTLFLLMFVSVYFHARSAPPEERRFLLVIFFSIVIGLIPRGWEFGKPLWLMFGLLLAPSVSVVLAHPAAQWRRRVPPAPMRQPALRRTGRAGQ
jgi:O-antigen ligase